MSTIHAQTFARTPDHPVSPEFVNRWSPRSFSAKPVTAHTLHAMVEAARWAPSSYNAQPWRFFVTNSPGATRDAWNDAILPFNRTWSDKAPVLVWVAARKQFGPGFPVPPETLNRHAAFDTGAAAVQLVLEGERHGLKAHYLGGVDQAKARALLGLGDEYDLLCAIVLGHPGDGSELSEGLRAREVPSGRKPAAEVAAFA